MRNNYLFILLSFVIILQSCAESKGSDTGVVPETEAPKAGPALVKVVSDRPPFTITLPGEIKPYEEVNIYPKIKGFVKRIYADRGSYVKKGQLLAELEAPEVSAQHAARNSTTSSAYQKFLYSKQSYNRLQEAARKNGAVAGIEIDRAYAQYLGDSSAYSSMRSEATASGQMKKYLRITAPFSGVITGRFISEGALVGEASNGQPLFQLTKEDKLRLVVAIPEKQAQAVQEGTKASYTLIDYPGEIFTATLSRDSRALDTKSKSLLAEFDINNSDNNIRSGQYAKVNLELQKKHATLWVPASSIVQAQSGTFVVKNENGFAKRIPVQLGVVKDELVEIYGALNEGDELLKKGSEEMKEGRKIGS